MQSNHVLRYASQEISLFAPIKEVARNPLAPQLLVNRCGLSRLLFAR